MKKLMILAAVAATLIPATGMADVTPLGPYNWKTATEAQYREVLDAMLAQANEADCWKMGATSITNIGFVYALPRRNDLDALRIEADSALADKGYSAAWSARVTWPRVSAARREKLGIDKAYLKSIALSEKYGCDIAPYLMYTGGATLGELVECFSELASHVDQYAVCHIAGIDGYKKTIQGAAVKGIKRALRAKGVSFVSKNGVNPCEEYMTRLTAALNAPRFAGLNEWLADLGFKERVDLSGLPSEAEIVKLKEDIMYGDVNMNDKYKTLLYICLGVDGFNQFVREYNGD